MADITAKIFRHCWPTESVNAAAVHDELQQIGFRAGPITVLGLQFHLTRR